MKFIDLSGQIFGNLTVIRKIDNHKRHTRFLCKCSCGNTTIKYSNHLSKNIGAMHCGCKFYKPVDKEKRNAYHRMKRKTDMNYKISCNLRHRIWCALNGVIKSERTMKLLDCSIDDLKKHLESNFTKIMSWDNYGSYWEIDHIKPCASFDLSKPEEQQKCFHYSNMQPLTINQNRRKGGE